jgi:hypothetical protein
MLIPHLLDLLLGHIICWIVVMVVRPALKTILSLENNGLLIVSVETGKWKRVLCSFFLLKDRLSLGSHICLIID